MACWPLCLKWERSSSRSCHTHTDTHVLSSYYDEHAYMHRDARMMKTGTLCTQAHSRVHTTSHFIFDSLIMRFSFRLIRQRDTRGLTAAPDALLRRLGTAEPHSLLKGLQMLTPASSRLGHPHLISHHLISPHHMSTTVPAPGAP